MTRPGVWVLPLAVLAGAFLLRVGDDHVAPRVASALFDTYQHYSPRAYEDTRARTGHSVRYVDIDAPSLARYGAWPWPRALMVRLVERLREGGAALVVMTMPLSEPDAGAPQRLLSSLPEGPEGEQLKKSLAVATRFMSSKCVPRWNPGT